MMRNLFVATIFVFFLLSSPIKAFSQTVLQEAVINGKIIELLDNKTWRYKGQNQSLSSKLNSNCPVISNHARFCVPNSWKVGNKNQVPSSDAVFLIDSRNYALFIIEKVGSADGFSNELLVKSAHTNAANAANIPVESLDVLFTRAEIIDGRDGLVTSYEASVDGLSFTYINNIYVGKNYAIQAIVFTIGGMNKNLKANNADLLANIETID